MALKREQIEAQYDLKQSQYQVSQKPKLVCKKRDNCVFLDVHLAIGIYATTNQVNFLINIKDRCLVWCKRRRCWRVITGTVPTHGLRPCRQLRISISTIYN